MMRLLAQEASCRGVVRFFAPLACALAFTFSSLAWAYVPPAAFIIKAMASKREDVKAVRIRSTLTLLDPDKPEQSRFKLTHNYNGETGVLRTTMSDEAGRPLYLYERELKSFTSSLSAPAQAIGILLLEPNWTQVVQVLRKQGLRIPSLAVTEASADPGMEQAGEGGASASAVLRPSGPPSAFLARWNKSIAWVVGERAASSVPSAPQLWVEKDTFLPLRWVNQAEIEFQNYKLYRDLPYPRVITFAENKKPLLPILKEELIELKATPAESMKSRKAGGFDKERGEAGQGFTETGRELPESVRDLIQRYFEPL